MTRSSGKPLLVVVSGLLLPVVTAISPPNASLPKPEPSSTRTGAGQPPKQTAEITVLPAVDERLKRAQSLVAAGKLAEAEKDLIESDRLQPDSGPILDALARLQIRMRKRDAAIGTMERLIRRGSPFDDRIYVLAAQTFAQQGRHVDGEKRLIEWASNRPLSANILAAIGILRLGAYDLTGAEEPILKALELDPVNEAALKVLFQVYGNVGHYDKAQPYFDRAVELQPRSVPVRMLSGSSLMRQKKYVEARYQFQKLVEVDKRNAAAWSNLGSAAYAAGDREQGLTSLRMAVELDGRAVEAPINLATALQAEKRFVEARDTLLAARKRGIEDVDLLNALAVAYDLNGEVDLAIATIRESLARDHDQEQMKKLLQRIEGERAKAREPAPASAPSPDRP